MNARYDICTGRDYTDRDGNPKTAWTRIGMMVPAKTGEGFAIKLEALPLPNRDGDVWIKAFPFVPKEEREAAPAPRQAPQERQRPSGFPERPRGGSAALDGDEIPFNAEFR